MGWLSWQCYRCIIDCDSDPNNYISEKLYMRMADLLVSKGYRDVGYEYVNIDNCWPSKERDSRGSLVANTQHFPSGIKVHARSLKLGIYTDFGLYTCGRYPCSKFYLQKDAETFASWGVDMLKMDGCYTDVGDMAYGYPTMGFLLNMTDCPMLYSCSWPAYDNSVGQIELWTRSLSPNGNRVAFVFLKLASGGAPSKVSCPMTTIIPTTSYGYNVTKVFSGMFIGSLKPQDLLNITVNPSGVFFGLAVPLL